MSWELLTLTVGDASVSHVSPLLAVLGAAPLSRSSPDSLFQLLFCLVSSMASSSSAWTCTVLPFLLWPYDLEAEKPDVPFDFPDRVVTELKVLLIALLTESGV